MDKGAKVENKIMDNKKDRKFGMWVMAALLSAMFFIYYFSSAHQNEEEMVVQNQLEAIEEKRLTEAYYAYTSKDFQVATSLEAFKKFLSSLPLLTQTHTVEFSPSDTAGKVQANIKTNQEELKLVYALQKQDKVWKVQKIEVMKEVSEKLEALDFDATIFQEPIKNHIQAIREKKIEKAYHDYTATAFQEATSLKDFNEFVKDYPVFSENGKVDYKKLTFNNNIGTYEILMMAARGTVYDLKYDLISENGVWKILQIQITERVQKE
jgi:hypothetical protein